MLKTTEILGVKITAEKEDKILEFVLDELAKPRSKRKKIVIFTPNPEQISAASRNPKLKSLLNEADLALPDGVGVLVGARLMGKPVEARIPGVDFMKNLVKSVSKQPVNTGYFGGAASVAEACANCLQKSCPGLRVSYASDVYDKEKMIQSDTDILFVALGFPKQEQWIMEHKDEIPASVIMAVGGSFDYISGKIVRAPKILRTIGLEWLFRLAIQPQRFFRQLRIWHFGGLILGEALTSRVKKLKKSSQN